MIAAAQHGVIHLGESLDVVSCEHLKRATLTLIAQEVRCIYLNLSELTYIDSAGVGVILFLHRKAHEAQCRLALLGVHKEIYRYLVRMRLVDQLAVAAVHEDACELLQVHELPVKRVTLKVSPEHFVSCRKHIQDLIEHLPLTAHERFDLMLAAGEAVGNAIDHTCEAGILVTLSMYSDRVIVEVSDCGQGFDPDEALERSAHLTDHAERGRGLRLMHLLVDACSIEPKGCGCGMRVLLAKRFSSECVHPVALERDKV